MCVGSGVGWLIWSNCRVEMKSEKRRRKESSPQSSQSEQHWNKRKTQNINERSENKSEAWKKKLPLVNRTWVALSRFLNGWNSRKVWKRFQKEQSNLWVRGGYTMMACYYLLLRARINLCHSCVCVCVDACLSCLLCFNPLAFKFFHNCVLFISKNWLMLLVLHTELTLTFGRWA